MSPGRVCDVRVNFKENTVLWNFFEAKNCNSGLRGSLSSPDRSGHIVAREVRPARTGMASTPIHPALPRTGGWNALAAPRRTAMTRSFRVALESGCWCNSA